MRTFKNFVESKDQLLSEAPALPAGVQAVTTPQQNVQQKTPTTTPATTKAVDNSKKQTAQGFQDLAVMFKQFSDKMKYIAGGLGRA